GTSLDNQERAANYILSANRIAPDNRCLEGDWAGAPTDISLATLLELSQVISRRQEANWWSSFTAFSSERSGSAALDNESPNIASRNGRSIQGTYSAPLTRVTFTRVRSISTPYRRRE